MDQSRRHFLRTASLTSAMVGAVAAPSMLNLALSGQAAAQTANDYKALVCIFFFGGNDSFNTVLATDTSSWTQYKRWRDLGNKPISLPGVGAAGGVLPIVPNTAQSGRSFALHPNMSELVSIFNAGRLGIVSNVGPITGPLNLSNFGTGVVPFLPPSLFSHNDQQSYWQAQRSEGASAGWGGRMGDLFKAGNGNNAVFTALSASGSAVWLSGEDVIQYQLARDGGVPLTLRTGTGSREPAFADLAVKIMSRNSSHILESEAARVAKRSLDSAQVLRSAMLPRGSGGIADPTQILNPFRGVLVDNPLAVQLQTVARIIGARTSLGVKRQLFFVSLGGFDTHSDQANQQPYLMTQIDHGMSYFDTVLANVSGQNLRSSVTSFTASDFGRTFTSNGSGTDHGFGGHHFVMGGAVKGKDIHGTFPESGTGHARDYGNGILLPQFSVDQYGATLARWFGNSDADLNTIFPNLSRFSTRNLGFMV
jgi:uncharacterized protein (DUF1501 family)